MSWRGSQAKTMAIGYLRIATEVEGVIERDTSHSFKEQVNGQIRD